MNPPGTSPCSANALTTRKADENLAKLDYHAWRVLALSEFPLGRPTWQQNQAKEQLNINRLISLQDQ